MSILTSGVISPRRDVPASIPRPEYVDKPAPTPYDGSYVTAPELIEKMRVASKLAAQALQAVGAAAKPGVTTDELDAIGHDFLVERGAYPSTLGYRNYPKSLCTSVNEVICHGIPDDRPLQDGDIVNVDITAYLDGVHGDTNATFGVGDVTGHGIATSFHSGLIIPHYDDERFDDVIETGMTFTIEPMLTLGTFDYDLWDDDWTAVTKDGSRTAQFEHTLVVTDTGAEVLTLP